MNNNSKLLSALLIGAAAGAVLGLLFAPDKGSETRKKIKKQGDDLMDRVSKTVEDGKKAFEKLKGKAMDKAEDLKDEAETELNGLKNKGKQMVSHN